MPNAKHTLTTLLSNIEAAFDSTSEEDKDLFKSSFNGALDLSTNYTTQIYGHTSTTIISSLRSALQAVSNGTSSTATANGAWNPIIAAVFNTLEGVVLELDNDDLSSRVSRVNVNDSTQSSGLTKKITIPGGIPARPLQNVKPIARSDKPVSSKPTGAPKTLSVCPNDVTVRVRAERAKNANIPVFRNLSHVKCVKPNCTFCINLWLSLPLTKCTEITCHKKATCNRDGWYAHVYPTTWLMAKKDHDAGRPFPGLDAYKAKPSVEGTAVQQKSPIKRGVTYASAVKCNAMDYDSTPSPKQPKMDDSILEFGEPWSDHVESPRSNDSIDLNSGELSD